MGTRRQALASVANGGAIDATRVAGTILLTSGEIVVDKSVTIFGPGILAVDGNGVSRVFHITGVTARISGLTITNGQAPRPVRPSEPALHLPGRGRDLREP